MGLASNRPNMPAAASGAICSRLAIPHGATGQLRPPDLPDPKRRKKWKVLPFMAFLAEVVPQNVQFLFQVFGKKNIGWVELFFGRCVWSQHLQCHPSQCHPYHQSFHPKLPEKNDPKNRFWTQCHKMSHLLGHFSNPTGEKNGQAAVHRVLVLRVRNDLVFRRGRRQRGDPVRKVLANGQKMSLLILLVCLLLRSHWFIYVRHSGYLKCYLYFLVIYLIGLLIFEPYGNFLLCSTATLNILCWSDRSADVRKLLFDVVPLICFGHTCFSLHYRYCSKRFLCSKHLKTVSKLCFCISS